ncbi:protein white [Diorhabda carinulata]|uniref:protein white n=1 Tax=Diorhabda carinulata TaxID=1163345 RepID=UPI0025A2C21D|nr:protein white [Diorhabda carinulata]
MSNENIPLLVSEPYKLYSSDTKNREVQSSQELQHFAESFHQHYDEPSFDFVEDVIPENDRATLAWKDVIAYFQYRKSLWASKIRKTGVLLHGVSGVAYPGEILAILGGSGSGKSTLLHAITGTPVKHLKRMGEVRINGEDVCFDRLRNVSGHVHQHDIFIPTLTVREHLLFHAYLRMDQNVTLANRKRRVDKVLMELYLKDKENFRLGSIYGAVLSSGERRRVSFATEILSNPLIMFCDEPTSGLDTSMALQIVRVLQSMKNSGRTILCSVHQPNSDMYNIFDKVLYLVEGRLIYLGGREAADTFFKTNGIVCPHLFNPADYYIRMTSINPEHEERCYERISYLFQKFRTSDEGLELDRVVNYRKNINTKNMISYYHKASCCVQFCGLIWRSLISILKDPALIKVRLFQTVITSLLIAVLYFNQKMNQEGVMNLNGVLFLFLTSMTFQNVFAVIHTFTMELPIFLREHRKQIYRTDIYFLSKTLAELPFFVIIPLVFTSVCYFLVGLNPHFINYATTCGIMVLVANVALGYGYFISCMASTQSMALSLGGILLIPFLLFGGYFMNLKSIPKYFEWLSYTSWFRHGNEALMVNQWKDVTNIQCSNNSTFCARNGQEVLQAYSFREENFYMNIVVLLAEIIVFRVLAYSALVAKTK